MLRPSEEAGFPPPFVLQRSTGRHVAVTAFWIGVASALLWSAFRLLGGTSWPAIGACFVLGGWAALRAIHNIRLFYEDDNLLILDAAGVSAPRLFWGSLPWSAVQGALLGSARGAQVLRLFVDARALGGLQFRPLSDAKFDRFDLTFSWIKLRKSVDHVARGEAERAALACNAWVAAEAGRFADDDPAIDKARRFAATARSLIAAPSQSRAAVLAIPMGLAFGVALVCALTALTDR
jgi:hypothetical protein